MFENVDGRTDAGVTGILIAHLGAFGSGELKKITKNVELINRECSIAFWEVFAHFQIAKGQYLFGPKFAHFQIAKGQYLSGPKSCLGKSLLACGTYRMF